MASSFLKDHTIGEAVDHKGEIWYCNENTTLEEATTTMLQKDVRCLPVWDKEKSKFVGIVDMFEIASLLAFKSGFEGGKVDPSKFKAFAEGAPQKPVSVAMGLGKEGQSGELGVWTMESSAPLEDVMEPMSKGVHRILVSTKDKKELDGWRVLTQTDVVKFLWLNKESLPIEDWPLDKKIGEIGLVNGKVRTIPSSAQAVEAFQVLFQDDVLSVAVVNEDGVVVDNLSTSDVRGVSSEKLRHMLDPISEFVKLVHGERHLPPVTCSPDTLLKDVMSKAVASRVHRVWVVDEDGKPVGVVALSDVICKFSPFDFKR